MTSNLTSESISFTKPTIVIIPGSFCPPSLYDTIIDDLTSHGYEAFGIHLPSVGSKEQTRGITLNDDAQYIRDILTKLADQGKDIVLAMHSYGGIAGTESASGLSIADRRALGKSGGIMSLLYVTALIAPVGVCLNDLMKPYWLNTSIVEGDWMYMNPESAPRHVFNDLPESEGVKWTALMPGHSAITFRDRLTYPAYEHVPTSYLLCERDAIIPPELQLSMIQYVQEQCNRHVTVYTCSAGHCPNASNPGVFAESIRKAAGESI